MSARTSTSAQRQRGLEERQFTGLRERACGQLVQRGGRIVGVADELAGGKLAPGGDAHAMALCELILQKASLLHRRLAGASAATGASDTGGGR